VASHLNSPNSKSFIKTKEKLSSNYEKITKVNLDRTTTKHNKSMSTASALINSRNILKPNKSINNISSNSFFYKNSSQANLSSNYKQYINNSQVPSKKPSNLSISSVQKLRSPPEFKVRSNNDHKNDDRCLSVSEIQYDSYKEGSQLNTDLYGSNVVNMKQKMNSSKLLKEGEEKNVTYLQKMQKQLNLNKSVNLLTSKFINEFNDYEANSNSKSSSTTKDNSLKNSIVNRNLENATIEDMHILYVKFHHQSRKIEKKYGKKRVSHERKIFR